MERGGRVVGLRQPSGLWEEGLWQPSGPWEEGL